MSSPLQCNEGTPKLALILDMGSFMKKKNYEILVFWLCFKNKLMEVQKLFYIFKINCCPRTALYHLQFCKNLSSSYDGTLQNEIYHHAKSWRVLGFYAPSKLQSKCRNKTKQSANSQLWHIFSHNQQKWRWNKAVLRRRNAKVWKHKVSHTSTIDKTFISITNLSGVSVTVHEHGKY